MTTAPRHRHWLLKTEPETFSLADLHGAPKRTTRWDGVRNYQARNFLRDSMQVGDPVLIYHSRTQPLAIVGTAEVTRAGYPDPSQFDPQSPYFDPLARETAPRWFCVDIVWRSTFAEPVTRAKLLGRPECDDMVLLKPGSRLSVQPVSSRAWGLILALAQG